MKRSWLFILLTCSSYCIYAQSPIIKEVFRLLPKEKVWGLTRATRDSLLAGKAYYPPDNDSLSVLVYNYGVSTSVADYMYLSQSYETSQRATGMIEIRSFPSKGVPLILVSNTGGVWQASYHQNELIAYRYVKGKGLVLYNKRLLPPADESLFLKKGVPDSVRRIVRQNANTSFDLSRQKVALALNSSYLTNQPSIRNWLKGDRIEFSWTGDRFLISRIGFDE